MYQVLLLDDEIMAVEYLETVIEWEEYGFQIAKVETQPLRALKYLQNNRVDIAIVDIHMPGLDGLEFAKKALEIQANLKIIIVTSYDDFEYARKAISLGVSYYILKHDLETNVFLNDLQKIRTTLDKEKINRKTVVTSLLRKIIEHGDILSESEKKELHQYIDAKNKHMICFWVELDKSLLKNGIGEFGIFTEENDGINEFIELLDKKSIITINLSPGRWLVLEAFEPTVSQKKIREESFRVSYQIQRFVHNNYGGKTVSVIPSPVFNDIMEIRNIYIHLKEHFKYLIFYGKNRVLDIRELEHRKSVEKSRPQETLDKIYDYFNQNELNEALREVDSFLGACMSAKDADATLYFKNELIRFLGKYMTRHSLQKNTYEEILKSEAVYSVQELHMYLGGVFEVLINEKQVNEYRHIPEKIRASVRYIHEHYKENICLEDAAASMGISGEYLRHLFKTEMREGFSEYLTKLRVAEAKKLLAKKRYKVYEVAEMVGYKSGTYFSSVFEKVTGVRPLDYKAGSENEKKRN